MPIYKYDALLYTALLLGEWIILYCLNFSYLPELKCCLVGAQSLCLGQNWLDLQRY